MADEPQPAPAVTPELLKKAGSRASMIASLASAADQALKQADRMLNDLEKDESLKAEVIRALGDKHKRLLALLAV